MKISVIIPTLNEEKNIGSLVQFILHHGHRNVGEVIVVDGNSSDQTAAIAATHGAKVHNLSTPSRAAQMNLGARHASGEILYFVHADVKLPASFGSDVLGAIEKGSLAGCYRFQFDSPRRILKINAFMTRFNRIMCRGGDQTLFIRSDIFKELEGYNEYFIMMEEYDLIQRIQKKYAFHILPKNVMVSARKYDTNSWFSVQFANLTVFIMFFLKRSPTQMQAVYKKMLNYR